MVNPVNCSCYVNGRFIRTTTNPQTSILAGNAYSQQQIQVTAQGNYGHSASGTKNVLESCGTTNCGE